MDIRDKIATIVPVAHFDLVKDDRYHMALSHLMDHEPYRKFYYQQLSRGSIVIMDNGVVETGAPESFVSYLDKAIRFRVSEVVVPDFPNDKERTLKTMELFFYFIEQTYYRGSVMAVPHGKTWDEWKDCLERMLEYPVQTIGISRLDYDRGVFQRPRAVEEALEAAERAGRTISVHLLGCTDAPDMSGVGPVLYWREVRGIDSSIAALFARHGALLAQGSRRLESWAPLNILDDQLDLDLLRANLVMWKALCKEDYTLKGGDGQ